MKKFTTSVLLVSSFTAVAQVEVDGPLRLTGDLGERGIDGLSLPSTADAALTVEGSLLGVAHWATATAIDSAITINPVAGVSPYRDGELLRFLAPSSIYGPITLACTGLLEYPLVRPDGIAPVRGQVRTGAICEVLFATDHWILLNSPVRGCPDGTTRITDRLCMETVGQTGLFFYGSADRCASEGGRLCGWDEFYIACTQFPGQLTGMLDAWEWLDDSSNHANSAVQVGFATCTAQRWANPQSNTTGRSRCCFDPR